ncbi:hypothetical protein ACFFJT_14690 [Dyella flava]|uniref:Antitoxin Xre/MbcA/ParS-like toxin-binding domain-containing protein n=1 Tax=Dyella flava TaxID=1920170 RepID=A0ABS2K003_9GAMM|nr:hypothetical protein [Dyella flava]MBM7124062.1 hypothetical protein [Dyella flava]GLQ50928.1 hypothetical protein GCM10010872_23770 [Dyella flava]
MTTQLGGATWDLSRNNDDTFDRSLDMDFWRVLQLAKGVEHDEARVREWYSTVKIHELDGKTAQELVQMGEADLVIGFLRSIRRGNRD